MAALWGSKAPSMPGVMQFSGSLFLLNEMAFLKKFYCSVVMLGILFYYASVACLEMTKYMDLFIHFPYIISKLKHD